LPLLIISGGANPHENAVNHIENVRWVGELWQSSGPVWALVADGLDPAPDFSRVATGVDETVALVQQIVMRSAPVLEFENSTAPWIVGAARRADLDSWVQITGATLSPGQDLTVYVTDHGVGGNGSRVVMWGEELSPEELAQSLDRLPVGVGVRLVMAQCYAGGFTSSVEYLLHRGRRACGFFAAPADRPAAGCRHDSGTSDYEEFTTAFFEALFGVPRVAVRAQPGQAARTFAEAHYRAALRLQTIDVPVATREAFAPPAGASWPGVSDETVAAIRSWGTNAAPRESLDAWLDERERLRTRIDETEAVIEAALLDRFPWLLYPFVPEVASYWSAARAQIGDFVNGLAAAADWRALQRRAAALDAMIERAEIAVAREERGRRWRSWLARPGDDRSDPRRDRVLQCENAPPPVLAKAP
jgi:hypothetical protein